jgi:hypothetical protein
MGIFVEKRDIADGIICPISGALIESWSENRREAEKMFSTCVLTDEVGVINS